MKELIELYNKKSLAELEQKYYQACEYDDINEVQLLLNSKKLKQCVSIDAGNNLGFIKACKANNLSIVRYLLTSKNLKKHANMFMPDNNGFRQACSTGALDVVKYLMSSPELKEHVDLVKDKGEGLAAAINSRSLPLIQYLIYECEAEVSKELMDYIQRLSIKDEINNIIAKRDLKKNLEQDLASSDNTNKRKL